VKKLRKEKGPSKVSPRRGIVVVKKTTKKDREAGKKVLPNKAPSRKAPSLKKSLPRKVQPRKALPPRKAPPRKKVPPRKVYPRKKVQPRKAPPRKKVPPRPVPPRKKVPPRQVPPRKKVPPRKVYPRKKVQPRKAPPRKKVQPRKAPPRKKVPPRKAPPRKKVQPRKAPPRKKVSPRKAPPRKKVPPRKAPPKPEWPRLPERSQGAEAEVQASLLGLQGAIEAEGLGIGLTVQSFINRDGTVDGELRVDDLPDGWRVEGGGSLIVEFLSRVFQHWDAFPQRPEVGGAYWVSFGVRFGPRSEAELEQLERLYKKHRGLFQIGTYPVQGWGRGAVQLCLTDYKVGLRAMLDNMMDRRGMPPTSILIRVVWTPDGTRPGHYEGEK